MWIACEGCGDELDIGSTVNGYCYQCIEDWEKAEAGRVARRKQAENEDPR